jgi:hypothetical protein
MRNALGSAPEVADDTVPAAHTSAALSAPHQHLKQVTILNSDNALFYTWVHRSTIQGARILQRFSLLLPKKRRLQWPCGPPNPVTDTRPPCPAPIPPLPDVTLALTAPRVSPDHPRDLNGHHGITIAESQGNLVQR